MPQWITPAGFISTVLKGNPFTYNLSYDSANLPTTFVTIAGEMPPGLSLSGPDNGQIYPLPSIWGAINVDALTGNYTFSIRATSNTGVISDRAFTIQVLDPEPEFVFPDPNLGQYPGGEYMIASVAPTSNVPELMGNITVISGNIPGNVVLNPTTGILTGYVNPSVLFNTGPIYPNMENGAPNVSGSANTAVFNFTVGYTPNNSVEYTLEVIRSTT